MKMDQNVVAFLRTPGQDQCGRGRPNEAARVTGG